MNTLALMVFLANLTFDVAGQLSFKAAASKSAAYSGLDHLKDMFRHHWVWLGIFFYIGEFIFWVAFLSLVPLSIGVMLVSINIVVIMVAGRMFFNEKLNPLRLAGILLISLGVLIVGLSNND